MNSATNQVPDGSTDTLSFPPLDFRAARRRLFIALIASVIVPLSFAGVYAYYTYQRAVVESEESLDRLAWIAESKLTNIFDLNRELTSRVEDMLGTDDAAQIARREKTLHTKLGELVTHHPQIAALSVVDSKGRLLASSRFSPVPVVSIGDRADFLVTRESRAHLHVSLPELGRVQGTDIINTLTARSSADGHFIGAVVVSLRRNFLIDFYRQLTSRNPALTVGLYRQDGGVLVRMPPPRLANPPARHAILANAFVHDPDAGLVRLVSPLDGTPKIMAYRRAAQYPVYVSAGYAMDDVTRAWWHEDMSIAGVALVPCVCLWLLIAFSLRRLKAEEDAWHNWRSELARRRSAEATTRQLQRMGALGNLVASVAHDFNNLLMVVTANMEIARRKDYNGVMNEINAVERASISARALARRLMSVARRQPLQQHVVDPKRWLDETEPLIRSAISSKTTLRTQIDESVWTIKVDSSELTSAIINIAVNAKDAMPHGGEFFVRCENIVFPVQSYGLAAGEYVALSAKDSGTGMAADVARQAFEPLFTTKAPGAGTGLGLAQVLAMAEQAGGAARAETAPGYGTTIFVYLPRWTGEVLPPNETPDRVQANPRPANSKILLVEDNEEVAAGLVAVLDVLGWQARHEASGDAALRVLEEGAEFDLVLSDVQMPGQYDGIKLVEWIKTKRPKQAVTLMTGYAEHLEQARRMGVAVLAKPFNADDLSALLSGLPLSAHGMASGAAPGVA